MVRRTRPNKGGRIAVSCVQKTPGGTRTTIPIDRGKLPPRLHEVTAERVSLETIRDALKRLGVGWRRAKTWITSPDPQYALKKTGVTA